MHNFSAEPVEVKISLKADNQNCTLVNLLSEDHSYPDKSGKHSILFEPYGYRWFRIGGSDYLLRRSTGSK
jgi:maltose alpha-D-glucosyltransferase / alpha-amylase